MLILSCPILATNDIIVSLSLYLNNYKDKWLIHSNFPIYCKIENQYKKKKSPANIIYINLVIFEN
jgi:hypothetical protein